MFKLAGKFLQHVLPGVVRPLHILWNQVIGFLFLCLALFALVPAIKEIRKAQTSPRLFLTVPFVLIMAGFGISSFLRARKISRS